jgi:hypothetical protein
VTFRSGTKTPSEVKDYSFDWSDSIGADTITSSDWESSSVDLGIATESVSGSITTVWLRSGVAGTSYTVTNTIVTSGGRTLQDSITIYVSQYNFT